MRHMRNQVTDGSLDSETIAWDSAILGWLQCIPNSIAPEIPEPPGHGNQRKRRRVGHLPSPSMSVADDDEWFAKRIRLDDNTTPRPRRTAPPSSSSQNSSYILETTSASASMSATGEKRSRTGRSSPTKSLAMMHLDRLVESESFGGMMPVPEELKSIASELERDGLGVGVITQTDYATIVKTADDSPDKRSLFASLLELPFAVDSQGRRAQLGTLPPIKDLVKIWKNARRCFVKGNPEAEWNCAVHRPLLSAALEHASINEGGVLAEKSQVDIDVQNITTAQICPSYVPSKAGFKHEKRVDFCFFIEPRDSNDVKLITAARQSDPYGSINHTDSTPLLDSPIALTIETKRPSGNADEAMYQMEAWLASHWIRLQQLVRKCRLQSGQTPVGLEEGKEQQITPTSSARPPIFVPGIIIHGHDWYFVAATMGKARLEGGWESVVWSKISIGSTDTLLGMVRIITAVQRLAHWSALIYWPWFKQLISDAMQSHQDQW